MRQKSTPRLPVALPAPPARFRFHGKSFSRSEAPLAPPNFRQLALRDSYQTYLVPFTWPKPNIFVTSQKLPPSNMLRAHIYFINFQRFKIDRHLQFLFAGVIPTFVQPGIIWRSKNVRF